ncbi:MAG: pentapeptide repeat-containing protein [Pirellulales bacterium]
MLQAIRVSLTIAALLYVASLGRADIYRWDNGEPIPGTEGITLGPGVQLDHRQLQFAQLGGGLTGANFAASNLTNARLSGLFSGADFDSSNLTSARLTGTFTGADFEAANLTNAVLWAIVTNVNFSDAIVVGTNLNSPMLRSFTKEQLYSTASYQQRDLHGINLASGEFTGWDFSRQNLANASFFSATLTDVDLANANLEETSFGEATLTNVDLRNANLKDTYFDEATLTNVDLRNANLKDTNFDEAVLTNANLSNADLDIASVYHTTFRNSDLTNAKLPHGYGIDVFDDDYEGPHFGGSVLHNTFFGGIEAGFRLSFDAEVSLSDWRGSTMGFRFAKGNAIDHYGHAQSVVLRGTTSPLVVRDFDGPLHWSSEGPPVSSIHVDNEFNMIVDGGGTLKLVFEEDAWNSTITFSEGIPVALGGVIELTFAEDVDVSSQVGRTLRVFDWTGVNPAGQFQVASPHLWDLSNLYSTGEVTLLAVPEPSNTVLLAASLCLLCKTRSRRRSVR